MSEVSDPLTGLVKKIDKIVDEASAKKTDGQKLGTFVLVGDADGRADQLKKIAEKEALKRVSLCISAPPARYEVNKEAEVTVVIYSIGRPGQQQVTANFALRKGELNKETHEAILEELSKVLPK